MVNAKVVAANGKPVRMRDEATKAGNVIFTIDCGELVEVLAQVDDWYHIKYRNKMGYMMREFIEPIAEQVEPKEPFNGLYLYEKTQDHEKRITELENKLKELLGAEG